MSITSNPNRLVAALTPVVFAPLAGAITVLAAKYFPGVDIPAGSVEAIFIAGATIAFAKAGLWLKGWQEYEKRTAAVATGPDAGGEIDLGPDGDDGDLPEAHEELALDDEPDLEDEPDFDDEPELDDEPDFDEEPVPAGQEG
jgi:hypothetical protein